MPNGIIPGSNWPQTAQPHFAVPKINDDSSYFFFTVDDPTPINNPGLRYSIIDMRLDGGLGDVVASQKNIPVPGGNNASSVLTGTRHKNNLDVWIITREYNSNHYLSYLITPSGLDPTPVTSLSLIPPDPYYSFNSMNQIKISPDGSKMVFLALDTAEYCSFNSSTGQITPLFRFRSGNNNGFDRESAEFSIDSKYVYIASNTNGNLTGKLFQYDATKADSTQFKQSEILIYEIQTSDGEQSHIGMQRAVDGKIYCTVANKDSISVINNPKVQGLSSNFQKNAICLVNGNLSYYGLPQFIQRYYLYISHSGQCVGDSINFSSISWPPVDSLSWNFGDPASGIANTSNVIHPKHKFSTSGSFTVTLIVRHEDRRFDTVVQSISIKPGPTPLLGVDQTICAGDSVTFDAGVCSGCTYQWSNLTTAQPNIGTGQTYKTGEAATYMVSVTGSNGCIGRDTVQLLISPVPVVINNPLSKSICSGELTNIPLTSNVSGTMFHWTTTLTAGNISGFSLDSGIVINQTLVNHLATPG
ncbi:MAG: PKD domain-containing protein, partial [Bacteroidota bacterium]